MVTPKTTGDLMVQYLVEMRSVFTVIEDEIAATVAAHPTEPRAYVQSLGRINMHMNTLDKWLRDAENVVTLNNRVRHPKKES